MDYLDLENEKEYANRIEIGGEKMKYRMDRRRERKKGWEERKERRGKKEKR